MATATKSVLVNGQHTARPEFLRLLGESLQALIDQEGRTTYTVAVKLHVRDGSPVSASVGKETR